MEIATVNFTAVPGVSRFDAEIRKTTSPERAFAGYIAFQGALEPPETRGDPFLAACLLPAMFLGEDLEVRAPVSARLVRSLAAVQDIFLSWYPQDLRRITVRTPEIASTTGHREEQATAVFFSGGVDSWYSLLTHRDAVRALLTVKGFDIPLKDETVYGSLVKAYREVAAGFGATLLPVETNLREGLDPGFPGLGKRYPGDFWGPVLHGSFLGAVGLCLQRHFGRVIIPSTHSYTQLAPWGSHPLVDPLWSTPQTRFEHDDCEAGRTAKVRKVAESANALRHLRVCAVNAPGRYNCGACEKCNRTMLALHLFGRLGADSPFGRTLDLASLESWRLPPSMAHWYREMLAEAEACGHVKMIRLLRVLLGKQRSLRRDWQWLRTNSGRFGAWTFRKTGLPRHLRSIRKRWKRLRGAAS